MIFVRSVAFNLAFYAVLITMLVVGLPLTITSAQTIRNYAQLWARISLWLLKRICGVELEVRGVGNLPRGGFILAAKHQSFLDIIALLTLLPRFTFVMKKELGWIPLFGLLVLRAGMIPVDRAKGRSALADLTRRVADAVRGGQQLIIFPEGTRRPPGAEPAYKSGVAHLYHDIGVPCVPVGLNSGLFWPRRRFLRFPGTMVVEVLPPIQPGLAKIPFLAELQDKIEASSNGMIGTPLEAEHVPA